MSSRAVDLWPLLAISRTAADITISRNFGLRRALVSFAELWLMVESNSPIHSGEDISGKILAVRYPGTNKRVARLTLHPARNLRRPAFTERAGALCAHRRMHLGPDRPIDRSRSAAGLHGTQLSLYRFIQRSNLFGVRCETPQSTGPLHSRFHSRRDHQNVLRRAP